ncbi:MAG: TVP38/TMEM64 family protein [Negativicutes bacterium]|nr:TVP38/TMEM64 family protein [Negativicutes bacterium]
MTEPSAKTVYALKFGVLGVVIAAYCLLPDVHFFVATGVGYLEDRDFEGLRQFILSYGVWAPVTSIFLMAVQSTVPLVPGLIITITNAWIFGWQYGALYSWLGALLGAMLDFGIARWYGRPMVERFVKGHHLDTTDRFFQQHGVLAVFVTRLTPVIPFKVISYGAGLTTISLCQFLLATGIGQTPAIVLYSILGQHLARGIRWAIAITSSLIVLGVAAYYYRNEIERRLFSSKD